MNGGGREAIRRHLDQECVINALRRRSSPLLCACTETPPRFLLGYLLKCASAWRSNARERRVLIHPSPHAPTHSHKGGQPLKLEGGGWGGGCWRGWRRGSCYFRGLNVKFDSGAERVPPLHKTSTCIQARVVGAETKKQVRKFHASEKRTFTHAKKNQFC